MENDDTKKSQSETPTDLPPITTEVQATKKQGKPSSTSKKSAKQKKWSLWRHWKAASRERQAKWVLEALGVIIGVLILGTYIVGDLQTWWNFKTEHRPKVVISRPPELLGTFDCEVTDKAIHFHNGAMHIWVKNLRKGDAIGAFVVGPQFKLVPEKKIGDPFYDDLPSITDETCKQKVSPQMKAFPVNGGQEVEVNMVQGAGIISLIKTKSISVTFGGPQQEPETPPGEKPSERTPIAKDAIFQLYAPVCVYYFAEDGERYGSCRGYRLAIKGRTGSDPYAFSCTESPVSGIFEQIFFGYCEN